MPQNDRLWIPPLSLKTQKVLDKQRKRLRLTLWKWMGFSDKTLWDWLQLLAALAIPVVIAAVTLWFGAEQSALSSQSSDKQHQTDIQITEDQQEENALQTYLDRMSDLLLNNNLRGSQPDDEVSVVARSRTLTVLPQLNGKRKGELLRFLYGAGMISESHVVINLDGADLRRANLRRANLRGANLVGANLDNADFSYADLSKANLSRANLWKANLSYAVFDKSHLLRSDFSNADLSSANFQGATNITTKDLNKSKSLKDTIMLDGSKHP